MLLFTPGPVSVNKEILFAQTKEMITHRGAQYQALYKPIIEQLKLLLGAPEVHIMCGSGTLGIEANVSNALPAGAKALVLSNGAFGDKLREHCQLYYTTEFVRLNDAKGWNLERAKPHIDKAVENGVKLFAMVHHETSPGILNKCQEICNYAKEKGMLTLLDGTSAFPAYPVNHEKDGIDFYSWASQKAIGCPPGIVIISHSKDGISAIESSPKRSNYMNLKAFRKEAIKFENPNTPAISTIFALSKALELLQKEGHSSFMQRHRQMSEYARDEIKKMGFKMVVEEGFESNTVVPFYTPKNSELNKLLQSKYQVKLGGGHADWKDTTLRFCCMGDLDMEKVKKGIEALRSAKHELGI